MKVIFLVSDFVIADNATLNATATQFLHTIIKASQNSQDILPSQQPTTGTLIICKNIQMFRTPSCFCSEPDRKIICKQKSLKEQSDQGLFVLLFSVNILITRFNKSWSSTREFNFRRASHLLCKRPEVFMMP